MSIILPEQFQKKKIILYFFEVTKMKQSTTIHEVGSSFQTVMTYGIPTPGIRNKLLCYYQTTKEIGFAVVTEHLDTAVKAPAFDSGRIHFN
jgi:hypothetical protein